MVVLWLVCLSALILWAGFYMGFKLDAMTKAFERYGDRAFGMEEALRRQERELYAARTKPESKRKK